MADWEQMLFVWVLIRTADRSLTGPLVTSPSWTLKGSVRLSVCQRVPLHVLCTCSSASLSLTGTLSSPSRLSLGFSQFSWRGLPYTNIPQKGHKPCFHTRAQQIWCKLRKCHINGKLDKFSSTSLNQLGLSNAVRGRWDRLH